MTSNQDISWTSKLTLHRLKIIPFVADDPTAEYHPPANKGREAIMYLSYLIQFYDKLPDVSIFVHGDDITWHIDLIFGKSTARAINDLDLEEVLRRRYLNLRTDWQNACPAWINTTRSYDGSTGGTFFALHNHNVLVPEGEKFEEPYMKGAFRENFPGIPVPEILAQPCCSQFAVSKEAIISVPKATYEKQLKWLLNTPLSDSLTGRMWEHMWQFLFLGKAVDCPPAYQALCRGWHICFESQMELDNWNAVARERDRLQPSLGRKDPPREVLEALDKQLKNLRRPAVRRGNNKKQRKRIAVG